MKLLLLISLMAITVLSFKRNVVPPKYWVGQTTILQDNINYNVCYTIRAKTKNEADIVFRSAIRKNPKVNKGKIPTNPEEYSVWPIDFDNVRTINNTK